MKNKLNWIVNGSALVALLIIVLVNVFVKNESTHHRADEKQQTIKASPEIDSAKKELKKDNDVKTPQE